MVEFPKKIMPCLSIEWNDAKYTSLRISILSIWKNLQAENMQYSIWEECVLYVFYSYNDYRFQCPNSIAIGTCNEFIGANFTIYIFFSI